MTTSPAPYKANAKARQPGFAVSWLALAASPTFAAMGLITAETAAAMPLCSAGGILPVDGMTAMYLLMSLFHLPPWLGLARRRPRLR
jgi:hypothetical protein